MSKHDLQKLKERILSIQSGLGNVKKRSLKDYEEDLKKLKEIEDQINSLASKKTHNAECNHLLSLLNPLKGLIENVIENAHNTKKSEEEEKDKNEKGFSALAKKFLPTVLANLTVDLIKRIMDNEHLKAAYTKIIEIINDLLSG